MKTIRRPLFLAGVLLAAAAMAGVAQPRLAHSAGNATSSTRTITVSGNGAVTAVPDRASFQFGVTTRAATAKGAMAANATAAAALIAALKAAGVASADLQTTGVSLSPQTNQDGTAIVAYEADNSVGATTALANAGALVDAAVAAGADSVSGPSLSVSNTSSLYSQALVRALGDAKAKAQTIAGASGLTLGAIQSIEESGGAPPVPFAAKGTAASTPIEPGTQETDASVTVTYAIS